MGEVTFQDGFFVQKPAFAVRGEEYSKNLPDNPNESPITNFLGGAIKNNGNLEFVGKSIAFVDNTIDAVVREKKEGIYTVIRQDDYYKDTSKELIEAGSYDALFKTGFSFDTPDVINLSLMKEHLLALKNSETIVSPKYDFVTCVSSPDGEVKKPAKVILTEGLYVLNEEIRDVMDVKVYVFTPLEVIKERWYKRAVSRGKTGEAADLQFKNVNETAQQYIRPTYQIADCIINGMVDKDYIKVITDKILKKLAEKIDQLMQETEVRNDINGKIDALQSVKKYRLSDKIRTNINSEYWTEIIK